MSDTKTIWTLLTRLQTLLPYRNLICGWGYPSSYATGFIYNHSYPIDFVRWFLTKGMLWKSPFFQEWLRTKKTLVWVDVAKQSNTQFDPEHLERIERWHLQYQLGGGSMSQDSFIYFVVNMADEPSCRASLKRFQLLVPGLCQALKRVCPRPLLTQRETAILERRAMGDVIKQVAKAEGISDRTVRMHLQRIKRKLYTDDLVNAVVIAVKSGMLDQTWKEWRWRHEHPSSR